MQPQTANIHTEEFSILGGAMRRTTNLAGIVIRAAGFCAALALAAAGPAAAVEARLELPVTLTKKQALAEIGLVTRILQRSHPGVYQYQTKKTFDTLVANSRKSVKGEVNAAGHYLRLARIVASVCDSHTQISFLDEKSGLAKSDFKVFGEDLALVDGKLYAPSTYKSQPIAMIDDMDADDVTGMLRQYLPIDACADGQTKFESIDASSILTAMLGNSGAYRYQLAGSKARSRDAIKLGSLYRVAQFRVIFGLTKYDLKKHGFDECESIGLQMLCRDTANSVSLLKFWSFSIDDAESVIDRIFKKILADNDADLIIDLQDNPGGSTHTMSYFLSYMLKRSHNIASHAHIRSSKVEAAEHFTWNDNGIKKFFARSARVFRQVKRRHGVYTLPISKHAFGHPHFRGRITLLVNQQTYSAAVMAASILRQQRKAAIVGMPPGGSGNYSCAAAFGQYKLPHSSLILRVPVLCHSNQRAYRTRKSKRLQPDVMVPVTLENMNDYQFAVLEAARAHLGKPNEVAALALRANRPAALNRVAGEPADERIVFLIRNFHGVKSAKILDRASICFVGGSEAENHMRTFAARNNMTFSPVPVVDGTILESFYFMGRCDAALAGESLIRKIKRSMRDPARNIILPEDIRTARLPPDGSPRIPRPRPAALQISNDGADQDGERIIILVPRQAGVKTASDLIGKRICYVGGSQAETYLLNFFASQGRQLRGNALRDRYILQSRYAHDRCDAAVGGESLISYIHDALIGGSDHMILPEDVRQAQR